MATEKLPPGVTPIEDAPVAKASSSGGSDKGQPKDESLPPGVSPYVPSFLERLRGGAGAVRDVATSAVAKAGQYTPIDAAQAILSKLTTPRQNLSGLVTNQQPSGLVPMPSPLVPDESATEYAKAFVPQTGAQLGADVGLMLTGFGPLAKVAKAAKAGQVARRAIPLAARVGGATLGGAGGAALAGEDPVAGGVLGGGGALVGEGIGAAAKAGPQVVKRIAGRLGEKTGLVTESAESAARKAFNAAEKAKGTVAQQMVQGTQASQEAARVGQAMGSVLQQAGVPGMTTKTQQELYELARSGKGKQALDTMFEKAKTVINKRLGGRKLYIPEMGSVSKTAPSTVLGPNGQPITQRTMRKGLLTLDEALTELQNAGKGISQQVGIQRSTGSRQAALRYGEAREALINAVKKVDPAAAKVLDQALTGYRMGRSYVSLVEKSLDKSGRLDPAKLTANVNKYAEKLQKAFGNSWKSAESALTNGRRVPTQVPPKWTPTLEPYKNPPLPQMSPGAQTGIDIALQGRPQNLWGIGAASQLVGPLLRHVPGMREMHLESILDTMEP